MILANPDEQVWNLLTGGAGSTKGRTELDQLKRFLQEKQIRFVVDHDDRYHWIRMRSRRDLLIIQIKADVLASGDDALLEIRYAGAVYTALSAEAALPIVLDCYGASETTTDLSKP